MNNFNNSVRRLKRMTNLIINDIDSLGYESNYILRFDGCSKGNPGLSGAGAVIYNNNKEIWSKSAFIGNNTTNNVAEYNGLILGLKQACELEIKNLLVEGDSILVIKQMTGVFKVNNMQLITLHEQAKMYESKIDRVIYRHIYREFNKRADQLANEGIIKDNN